MIQPVYSSTTVVVTSIVSCVTCFVIGIVAEKYYLHKKSEHEQQQQHEKHDKNTLQSELPAPRRYGAIIKLNPDKYTRYRELHDNVWPDVLQRMYESNIRNFTIYYHKETGYLFQHFEWIGHINNNNNTSDNSTRKSALTEQDVELLFQNDMKQIADDPITRQWWKECEPCQISISNDYSPNNSSSQLKKPSDGGTGQWWVPLECVTHCGYWPIQFSTLSYDPAFVKLSSS